MDWKQVIGQQEAHRRLQQLIDEGRVPHALLFTGPQGSGKMALAMAFGCQLVAGDNPSANTRAMLDNMEHPDLHFTYPTVKIVGMSADRQPISADFASQWHSMIMQGPYFTLNQWVNLMEPGTNKQAIITGKESDEIARTMSLKSSQGGLKVSIIWLPERLNPTSGNKLLKLLEEPPLGTVFLMVSEEPEKLLETIRSRTQLFQVKRIDEKSINDALIKQRLLDADTARRIARIANGNWMKALEALDADNENREFLDMFEMLMRLCYQRRVKDLKRWTDNVYEFGREKQRRMIIYFEQQVRENFMYNFHDSQLTYMTQDEENFARNFARFINEGNIIGIRELLERCYVDIGRNVNARTVFYDMALKMIVLILTK